MTAFDDPRLARLLEHPALWRGSSAAHSSIVPTGFSALDATLPGSGWPQVGLVELLVSRIGIGELYLLLPALAFLTQRREARWCAWIAPAEPFTELNGSRRSVAALEPFAPALAAHGLNLERMLVVRPEAPLPICRPASQPASQPGERAGGRMLWACEQTLRSGACDAAIAWTQRMPIRALRRLQLAAERGRTLAFVFRGLSTRVVREPSPAVLRIAVQPVRAGARVAILKSRGRPRGAIRISWQELARAGSAADRAMATG